MGDDWDFLKPRPNNATQAQRAFHRSGEITCAAFDLETRHPGLSVYREDALEVKRWERGPRSASSGGDHGVGRADQRARGKGNEAIESLLQSSVLDSCPISTRLVPYTKHKRGSEWTYLVNCKGDPVPRDKPTGWETLRLADHVRHLWGMQSTP